jgi:pyrroline-5-carboxylate reductase
MKICILGCGNMGTAIADGLHNTCGEKIKFEVWDAIPDAAKKLKYAKINEPKNWFENEEPDVILIAVKPQVLKEALKVFSITGKKTLWVSIVAGTNTEKLEKMLPNGAKIARVMPNTPALIGESCSFYSLNEKCDIEDKKNIEFIFNAIGISFEISESQMNAATGLSGSGPAFVYTIIEAFAEAGVAAGLPYEIALKSAAKTLFGAAKMVMDTKESPAV